MQFFGELPIQFVLDLLLLQVILKELCKNFYWNAYWKIHKKVEKYFRRENMYTANWVLPLTKSGFKKTKNPKAFNENVAR